MTVEIQTLDLPIDSLTLDSYSDIPFVTTSTAASAVHETLDTQNNNGNGEITSNAPPHKRMPGTRRRKSCSTRNRTSVKRKPFAVDDFDFESYEYQMRVDRIDIDIALGHGKSGAAGTNFTSVRNCIWDRTRQNVHVKPLAVWDERRSALDFRITIQDPPTMKSIVAIVESLRDDFDVVGDPPLRSRSTSSQSQAKRMIEHFNGQS